MPHAHTAPARPHKGGRAGEWAEGTQNTRAPAHSTPASPARPPPPPSSPPHLQPTQQPRATRRVLGPFQRVPDAAADGPHAKRAANVVEDAVGAGLTPVVDGGGGAGCRHGGDPGEFVWGVGAGGVAFRRRRRINDKKECFRFEFSVELLTKKQLRPVRFLASLYTNPETTHEQKPGTQQAGIARSLAHTCPSSLPSGTPSFCPTAASNSAGSPYSTVITSSRWPEDGSEK